MAMRPWFTSCGKFKTQKKTLSLKGDGFNTLVVRGGGVGVRTVRGVDVIISHTINLLKVIVCFKLAYTVG